ncbi:MAG: cob(I)yrinic acid a,c-diamide adenosyltransferase [Candidatus Omnitrophica bacterium]|nr:cob(I)yrinic acid a,c-diamide adenosyltransferase [Candidatus Omnitrophota bacterium]
MIQVYTGNGKGKTTAALGLALRSAGAGKKVFFAQFVKGRRYSELTSLKRLKEIRAEQFGRSCFIRNKPAPQDCARARAGLARVKEIIAGRKFPVVILDEIHIALHYRLVSTEQVMELVRMAPKNMELVLTGRHAPKEIVACADLVSEIKAVKHYYTRGVKARRGIEY